MATTDVGNGGSSVDGDDARRIRFVSVGDSAGIGLCQRVTEVDSDETDVAAGRAPQTIGELRKSSGQVSLWRYLRSEVTRGYEMEQDEERYVARREKVYTFMKIPREVEKFMAYGFFQCADAFLFVYTFLPLRFLLALWVLFKRTSIRMLRYVIGARRCAVPPRMRAAQTCDLLKGFVLLTCSVAISYVDTSVLYHVIKSQSVIKLYIFFNMLEVGDRLFSSFGQDTIDALFWTAAERNDRTNGKRKSGVGLLPHLMLALIYTFLHALLVLFQATTLNVAINSSNKALLTIMMSNNFVELKGSVFKKFDRNNLFQLSCSDVRERFHLFVLLFVVVVQTMKEYAWKEERFWVLAPDCVMVLLAEVFVDWVKHAFITRFNEIPAETYRSYTVSLAYDLAQTKQMRAFSEHSDVVARRMGFIPLPLGVVMLRVSAQAVRLSSPGIPGIILTAMAYLSLTSFRVLGHVVTLGKACDLVDEHHQKSASTPTANSRAPAGTLSPLSKSCSQPASRSPSKDRAETEDVDRRSRSVSHSPKPSTGGEIVTSHGAALPTAPLFSNSTVSIAGACLNEEMMMLSASGHLGLEHKS